MQPNISQRLSELHARPKCTIYRVHGHLRNINDKAYEPEVIAIGPYHRGKDSLEMMEDHKLRYLNSLIQRKNENVQKYISAIEPLEKEARECYANPVDPDARKFVEMLILDGCFIIELVRKWNMPYLREENDPIFRRAWIFNSLQRDLLLFENQIPFFILCKLFDLIEVPDRHGMLMDLLTDFFRTIYPGKVCKESSKRSSREMKHLLELIHINLVSSLDLSALGGGEKERKLLRFIDSATLLGEANVEFKRNEEVSVLNIRFESGTMFLPPLTIEDRTESFLRNLIAYEQYFQDTQPPSYVITDYVKFFDCLIDSSKDVEILSGKGIIDNWLGDGGVVAKMFNKLTDSIAVSSQHFIYGKIFDEVHQHSYHHGKKVNMQPNLSQRLSELHARPKCTIYRVYGHLRNINDKAYEPEVIAIGPYHRGKDSLEMMEDHKLRYLNSLIQRKNENVQKYISAIEPLEKEARECYANPVDPDARKFVEMLILDGCFIIELVRKCNKTYLREENDPIFRRDWIINSLQRDLLLFENQIPFFVLCKLFDLIEVPDHCSMLMDLLTDFFSTIYPGKVCRESSKRSSHEIKHLLELIHINLVSSLDLSALGGREKERKPFRFIDSATLLGEANVEFKRNKEVGVFNIRFENGTMFLPPLTVEDRTESFLRNLIAYEQYFSKTRTGYVITDYVKFFDRLINSSKDVEILSGKGIIINMLGDGGVVAKMFNKLSDSIVSPEFIYCKIIDEVYEHCGKRRNRWMAKLRRNYLHSPWAIISVVAAAVLLLLTIAQTVFSAMQV